MLRRLDARHFWSLGFPVVCAFLFAGCGGPDTPPTAPVTGTITYKGKVVTGGTVQFYPQEGTEGNPASGPLGPDGQFTLTTYEHEDGAVIGKHVVTVQVFPEGGLPGQEFGSGEPPIPTKYETAATSDLTVEVKDEENVFNLVLED